MLEYFWYRYMGYLDGESFNKSLVLIFKDVGISKELSVQLKVPVISYIRDMGDNYELYGFKHVNSSKEDNRLNGTLWIEIKTIVHVMEESELMAHQFKLKQGNKFIEFYEKEKNRLNE